MAGKVYRLMSLIVALTTMTWGGGDARPGFATANRTRWRSTAGRRRAMHRSLYFSKGATSC
ncbi:hypothetical protein D7Z26_16890 [Cohnella endophytica]|uniref:Uncharacterized protein n=1 Tax=Cohnella endophytica TaxID=2419778 RepID=A0A494XRJ4_9BACL|nr:hypothetical protein D7Z26_16890 [Cohnella endophytica]